MAPAPCLPRSFRFAVVVVLVFSISGASGGLLGVDYGRDADNLIPPEKVVELLKANGIGAAAIYDGDARVIQAFRGSGIKLVVSLRNELLAQAARDPNFAGTWVWEHVGQYFPATQIEAVSVGNEVTHQRPDLTQFLLPAMQNVFNAISNLGHADKIKVSTPFAFSAVSVSFPPSKGSFRGDLQPLVRQILQFLDRTGSYFMITLYPFFTYRDVPNISREYFLGLPNPGVRDPDSGRVYKWLLHAQIDATFSAIAALGFGDTAGAISNATVVGGANSRLQAVKRKVAIKETGCPSCGRRGGRRNRAILEETDAGGSILNASSLAQEKGCSLENAQAYNSNLVRTILSGQTGTPLYPDADLDVYIFSLFNENLKPGPESEKTFGLFYPDGTKVYDVPFPSPGAGGPWCVANPAVGSERMQAALEWACGAGGADCGPIQPGASCYEPNTVEAHASYAMNSYYQRHGRGAAACDFSGVGRIVYQRPRVHAPTGIPPAGVRPTPPMQCVDSNRFALLAGAGVDGEEVGGNRELAVRDVADVRPESPADGGGGILGSSSALGSPSEVRPAFLATSGAVGSGSGSLPCEPDPSAAPSRVAMVPFGASADAASGSPADLRFSEALVVATSPSPGRSSVSTCLALVPWTSSTLKPTVEDEDGGQLGAPASPAVLGCMSAPDGSIGRAFSSASVELGIGLLTPTVGTGLHVADRAPLLASHAGNHLGPSCDPSGSAVGSERSVHPAFGSACRRSLRIRRPSSKGFGNCDFPSS